MVSESVSALSCGCPLVGGVCVWGVACDASWSIFNFRQKMAGLAKPGATAIKQSKIPINSGAGVLAAEGMQSES